MTVLALDRLIIDTETQLGAAIDAVLSGGLVDLTDLAPRLDHLCEVAILEKARSVAERLARLIAQLDALERLLRERIAATATLRPADPRRAAQLYRTGGGTGLDEGRMAPMARDQDAP